MEIPFPLKYRPWSQHHSDSGKPPLAKIPLSCTLDIGVFLPNLYFHSM